MTDEDRFWSKVDKHECWLWRGALNNYGYGVLKVKWKVVLAHRYSWELVHGPLKEHVLDHLCRTRHCVNPEHLELTTKGENIRRGRGKGFYSRCKRGHLYTGARQCMECQREQRASRRLTATR